MHTPQFLTGSTLPNLLMILARYKISRKFFYKIPALIFWTLLTFPLHILQKLFLLINPVSYQQTAPPVFIIGHWRSGTTYLHYLLSQDKNFCYPTNADVFAPAINIIGWRLVREIIAWRLPKTRPMDNVELQADSPQEEEFAIACTSLRSFYLGMTFPCHFEDLFNKYVLYENVNPVEILDWKKNYLSFLGTIQHKHKGKTMLLKNPVNTARIKLLIDLFPEARFIYLHRNPKEVVLSTHRMLSSLISINQLQVFDTGQLMEMIEAFHHALIKAYEEQRNLIGNSNLVEVNYDDLVNQPMQTVEKIYKQLRLPLTQPVKNRMASFVHQQKSYRPHHYQHQGSWV